MMIKITIKRKIRMLSILLPLILTASLLTVDNVFADDEIVPETAAEVITESTESSPEEAAAQNYAPEESEITQEIEETSDISDEEATADDQVDTALEGEDIAESGELEENKETGTAVEELEEALAEEEPAVEDEEGDSGEVEETGEEYLADTTVALVEEEITLVDGNGEAMDMASESSQESISGADPWWLAGGVKYAYVKDSGSCPSDTTFGSTCFVSSTPISSALTYMDDNNLVPSDGILHVEADSYTEDVTVDGSAGNGYLSSLRGIVSEGSSSDTTITGTVNISNTTSGFTLSGFTIIGSLEMSANVGTITLMDVTVESSTGTGINITDQNGAVKVEQVAADKNATYGMVVDNTAGKGSVTVTNSQFTFNTGGLGTSGLYIKTNGKIRLEGVSAIGNSGSGTVLDALKGTVITSGVFSNNGYSGIDIDNNNTGNTVNLKDLQVANNGYEGLSIATASSVRLENVTVFNNGYSNNDNGALIDTTSGSGSVTVSNSTFNDNYSYGAQIYSNWNITLSGLTAEGNMNGVLIDACNESGGICQGKGKVTISGKQLNSFSNNSDYGLYIQAGRHVYLSYFVADGNGSGVYITNDYSESTGNVTITLAYTPPLEEFINSISNNTSSGLLIYSRGHISIVDLVVTGNGSTGDGAMYLDNSSAAKARKVTVKNVDVYGNTNTGLVICSIGSVKLYNVNAYGNTGSGLEIDTSGGSGSIKVYATRSTTLDYTGNSAYGIYITSAGAISLSSIDATGNAYGLYIDNSAGDKRSVRVSSSDFSNSSAGSGVEIVSSGVIVMSGVVSSGNNISGILLDNTTASSGQTIKLTNIEASNSVTGSGLDIDSLGMVILNNVSASSNSVTGVDIDNCQADGGVCTGITGIKVTGSGSEFSGNGSSGLNIVTGGNVSLVNVSADNNGNNGLQINQTMSSKSPSVKMGSSKGYTNSFSGNTQAGVSIDSLGSVTLSNLEANNNSGSDGISIRNDTSLTGGNVSTTNAVANGNANDGLYILSAGSVTLRNVETLNNTATGIYIDNTYISSSGNVTIKSGKKGSTSVTSSGNANGMDIITNGNIKISSVAISSNTGYGANLDNGSGVAKSVILKNALFDDNGTYGVTITTTGTITWASGGASGNANGSGADLDNSSAASHQTVSISKAVFDGNSNTGLSIGSLGNITLNFVSANQNTTGSGVLLDNCQYNGTLSECDGTGKINIKGVLGSDDFNSNGTHGLRALSGSSITLMNVGANYNGSVGLNLKNNYTGAAGDISVKTSSKKIYNAISNNASYGLYLLTNGKIYLANLNASDNGYIGIAADNTYNSDAQSATLVRIRAANNALDGVNIDSNGAIVVKDAEAYENGNDGFDLDNSNASSSQKVSVSRLISRDNTTHYGLLITTIGDVTLNNIVATGNQNGAYVNVVSGTGNTVTLLSSKGGNIFSENNYIGLVIEVDGNINIKDLTAEWNGFRGADLYCIGKLSLTEAYLQGNEGDGLYITAIEGATLSKVQSYFNGSSSNDGDGLNLGVLTDDLVKISYSVFAGNYGDGIDATRGTTSLELYRTYYYGNDLDNDGGRNLNL